MNNIPNHIAIIPDGNRRWAKKKGLASFLGHKKGADVIEDLLKYAFDAGVNFVTIWGSSMDNILKRIKPEVKYLFNIYEKYSLKLAESEEVHKRKVKINYCGRWEELFPSETKKAIYKAIEATKNYKKKELTLLLAYSGVEEMEEAIQQIINSKPLKTPPKINKDIIKKNLWTKNLPPVDLVIRTGGEPHWSAGFMMWHTTDSQFYFTETLWPDFSVKELQKAIKEYARRERRLGR